MQKLIDSFIESLKADDKSKHTIYAYCLDLKEFAKFFNGKEVSQIKYLDLKGWINYLKEKGLSASSRSRKISTIKAFFGYLEKAEIIDKNPARILEFPKVEKKQPVVITMEEARALLESRKDSKKKTFFRDYTIMAVFIGTGIRREELTNILLSDVDLGKNTILVHGKGNKQRTIYINSSLRPILSEYILSYRGKLLNAGSSQYLFPSNKSEKMAVNTVNNVVNHFFENAGIKQDGISAHILRKSFATSVYESTHDIAVVSELLGHSSPTVTKRYVQIDSDRMREATNTVNF